MASASILELEFELAAAEISREKSAVAVIRGITMRSAGSIKTFSLAMALEMSLAKLRPGV